MHQNHHKKYLKQDGENDPEDQGADEQQDEVQEQQQQQEEEEAEELPLCGEEDEPVTPAEIKKRLEPFGYHVPCRGGIPKPKSKPFCQDNITNEIVKKIRTYGTFTLYELDPNNLGKAKEKVVDLQKKVDQVQSKLSVQG